ncbi:MAG: hypothetical protein ABL886_07800 [Rhodoglobus sp.]
MNPRAIDDLLSTMLAGFYRSAAAWTPPGRLSDRTCVTCSTSLLSEAIDTWRWPHDLMHDLTTSLTTVVAQIADSFADADQCGLSPGEAELPAVVLVRSALAQHRLDVLDVLAECVEPRLDAYVASEGARGLDDAAQWPQGHRG